MDKYEENIRKILTKIGQTMNNYFAYIGQILIKIFDKYCTIIGQIWYEVLGLILKIFGKYLINFLKILREYETNIGPILC